MLAVRPLTTVNSFPTQNIKTQKVQGSVIFSCPLCPRLSNRRLVNGCVKCFKATPSLNFCYFKVSNDCNSHGNGMNFSEANCQ